MTVMPIHPHLSSLGHERECQLLVKVPDVEGSSKLEEYKGWIPVDAMSATWVLPNDSPGAGRRRARTVTPGRVVLLLPVDRAALYLVHAGVRGKVYETFELHHVVMAEEVRAPLRQVFDNVVVRAARTDSIGALPILQLEVSYEKVHMTWTDIGDDGAPAGDHEIEWNIESGT